MSLINEALKKARTEAAEQEARRRGAPIASLPLHVPERRRRGWALPLVVGFLAALALAGGLWWWWRPAPEAAAATEADIEVAAAGETAPAAVEAPPAPPAAEPTGSIEPAEPADSIEPAETTEPTAAPAPPIELAAAPSASEPPAVPPPAPTPRTEPSPAPPAPAAPPARESRLPTHFHRVELAGGGVLELDFIVWSEKPFAQIDGRFVEVGDRVKGHRVVTIERERVVLEGPGGQLAIRAR